VALLQDAQRVRQVLPRRGQVGAGEDELQQGAHLRPMLVADGGGEVAAQVDRTPLPRSAGQYLLDRP
jgi:hypothetical protein